MPTQTKSPVILGDVPFRYEVVEGWAKLPPSIKLGYTHGVVVDAKDRVYVHNQSKDAVLVFDRDGNLLSSWGEEFKSGAHGLYLSRERDGREVLFLADYARHTVVKTTLDGKVLFRLGVPEKANVYKSADQYKPTDTCVAPNGDFYVCDGYGLSYIHQYKPDGTWVRTWGGPGQLNCPHGIWVDTRVPNDPRLLVADRGNVRLVAFTLNGEKIGEFARDDLRYPCCFYERAGILYVPDLRGRVTIFDRANRCVGHIGDNPDVWKRPGWPNIPHEDRVVGKFISPHALTVDSRGDMYVVEWVSDGRLTKLRRM